MATDPSRSPASSAAPVAVLGLGRMGTATAVRLAACGHEVVGWTRSRRTTPGVACVADLRDAVAGASPVLLCLYDAAACSAVLAELADHLREGAVVVNTSTVGPAEAVDLEKQVVAAGATYVHAPVVGSVPAVAAGRLTVLLGGAVDPVSRRLLDDLGTVLPCGDVAAAAAAKLLANGTLGDALLAVRRGSIRGAQLGLTAAQTWSTLERTAVGGLVGGKRRRLETGDVADADFAVGAMQKDLALLAGEAPDGATLRDAVAAVVRAGAVPDDADVAALCLAPPGTRSTGDTSRPHGVLVAPEVTAPPEVLAPLEEYAAGHATGDPAHHRRAFLPSARIEGLRDGTFVSWTLDDYCALFTGTPAADESSRSRRVDHLVATGTVGSASMTLRHGDSVFTDVFVLVLLDGQWRIANKVYHRAPA